jgi:acyl-CoA thioesterase FadM
VLVSPFTTNVALRWSDMDVYGHVNNARVVTLLEEARTALLFGEGADAVPKPWPTAWSSSN